MIFSVKKISSLFFISLLISAYFFAPFSIAKDHSTPLSSTDASAPIQVHGETVEYFQEDQKAVGTGHVLIDYEGARLEADKITVYMSTKKAVAEGNVTLTQKGSVFKGQHAEYDFAKKTGYVDKMDATLPAAKINYTDKAGTTTLQSDYYVKAQRIEKGSNGEYRAMDSYVTTCCGDSPFYKIQAHEIDIFPEDKVVLRNAVLFIKGLPVLFIPYYVQPLVDFDRLPVQLIPGKSHEWGAFLLSKWRYNLVNREDISVKGAVLLDYREKRGFGGGDETFYRGDKIGHGALRVFDTHDKNPPDNAEDNRFRVQWRHQSKIGADTTLTTEINKLSDDSIIKDFFYREEYERNTAPDNYVSIITAKPEYTFSILERHRIDDFVTSVDRDPELRFDTHNREFAGTPFYLRQEAQFTNLQQEYANTNNELNVSRFDLNHTLSYAGHVGSFSVTPRIGTRQTLYSRDIEGDDSRARSTLDPGVDVSTRFYKTYDVSINAWGLDYNQLRHIFQPTLSYNYRPTPTVRRTELQPFDDIDAIDKQNFFRFSFENNFQTKQHNPDGSLYSREIARINPFVDYDIQTGRLDNAGIQAEIYPYSWMGFQSDANLNTRTGKFETANFDVYFTRGPWKVSVGQRYVIDESSQTTADVALKVQDWEFRVYDRFEFEDGKSKEFEVTVSKYWNCVITDFTYNHREGDTFYIALRLKAFPTTPFRLQQSYNHPKAYPGEGAV